VSSADLEVDTRGLRCPIPVIRLGAAIKGLPTGSLVRLLATDPAARSDVAAFCRLRGHELVETVDEPEHTAYLVRRGG
jgi:tRNA 2-thiouridine synthesizing protein A